jgi:hypothetical protein
MKTALRILIPLISVPFFVTEALGQQTTNEQPQTKEYATVFVRVLYQGNQVVYDANGASRSPLVTMPNGKQGILLDTKQMFPQDPDGKLKNVGEVINYMAAFGWTLKSSDALTYDGDRRNNPGSMDFGEFIQLLTFERPAPNR